MKKLILPSIFSCLFLVACGAPKVVQADKQSGTVKYRKRGLLKGERKEDALAKADQHCKTNGFQTYTIDKQYDDGRYTVIEFKCK